MIKIMNIGKGFSSDSIDNYDNVKKFKITNEFLEEKIGFKKILKKSKYDTDFKMCMSAFDELKLSDVQKEKIGLIVVVGQNTNNRIPHLSAMLHTEIGLANSMTFDISQGCAGYIHGLEIIKSLMLDLEIKSSLLFTCDCYSDIVDKNDKSTAMLFGDAATCTLISNTEKLGYSLSKFDFGTLKGKNNLISINDDFLRMNGQEVVKAVLNTIPNSVEKILIENGILKKNVDLYIFHQASKYIVKVLGKKLNLPDEKVIFNSNYIGNTISSSIPIAFSEYIKSGEYKCIVLSGFGVGYTWGTTMIKLE